MCRARAWTWWSFRVPFDSGCSIFCKREWYLPGLWKGRRPWTFLPWLQIWDSAVPILTSSQASSEISDEQFHFFVFLDEAPSSCRVCPGVCGSLWGWCQAPGLQIPVKQICSGGQGLDFAVQHLQCWLQVSPVQASVLATSKCSLCGCRVQGNFWALWCAVAFAPSNSELSSNAWRIDPEICPFLPLPLSLHSAHGCSSCQSSMVVPVVSCDTVPHSGSSLSWLWENSFLLSGLN